MNQISSFHRKASTTLSFLTILRGRWNNFGRDTEDSLHSGHLWQQNTRHHEHSQVLRTRFSKQALGFSKSSGFAWRPWGGSEEHSSNLSWINQHSEKLRTRRLLCLSGNPLVFDTSLRLCGFCLFRCGVKSVSRVTISMFESGICLYVKTISAVSCRNNNAQNLETEWKNLFLWNMQRCRKKIVHLKVNNILLFVVRNHGFLQCFYLVRVNSKITYLPTKVDIGWV